MKKKVLSALALAAALGVLAVSSCSKVEDEIKNTTTTAEDITRSEAYLASIFNIASDVASSDSSLKKDGSTLLPAGAQLVFTDSSFTDGTGVAYYIDFGPLPGLLCNDGVTRAGRLDVSQSKRYGELGCVLELNMPESNNFALSTTGGMTSLSGKNTITRKNINTLNLKVENGKASNTTDGTITFSSDKDIVHQELGQDGINDDIFTEIGSGSGTNSAGKPYTWNITDSVVKIEKPNCSFPIKGVIELTSESSTYKIDFEPDNGGCDKKVVIILPNGTKIPKTFN
jgi:hypothetical protein